MAIYKDHESLSEAMQNDLADMAIPIGQKITNLIKEKVWEIVYDPYPPEDINRVVEYVRLEENGGFVGSWDHSFVYTPEGNIVISIYSDPEKMELDSEHFIHGHPGEGGQTAGLFGEEIDRRENMDMYIAEGTGYDFYMVDNEKRESPLSASDNWWTRPRDYFIPTLDELEDNNKLDQFFREEFLANNMILGKGV